LANFFLRLISKYLCQNRQFSSKISIF
jgi:hypothetical protein